MSGSHRSTSQRLLERLQRRLRGAQAPGAHARATHRLMAWHRHAHRVLAAPALGVLISTCLSMGVPSSFSCTPHACQLPYNMQDTGARCILNSALHSDWAAADAKTFSLCG